MIAPPEFLQAFFNLPTGTFTGHSNGRRYIVSRTELADGRSQKLVANELGGTDYISLNLYQLASGKTLLRPCEMSASKVITFTLDLRTDA